QQHVPRDDGTEGGVERPEGDPDRPAVEVQLLLRQRLEAVRVAPRRGAVPELVAEQPEAIRRLQVIAGRRLAVALCAARDEGGAKAPESVGRGDHGRHAVEADQDEGPPPGGRQSERAAVSSSSKSGTADASYRHALRMMPSAPTRKALRPDTSRIPRYSSAT